MEKIALILHGWPQSDLDNHFLVEFLKEKGFKVVTPSFYEIRTRWKIDEITEYFISKMEGSVPDVIIGISMGGLLVPYIAQRYPKSKLVFIASGASFSPESIAKKIGLAVLGIGILEKVVAKLGDALSYDAVEKLYRKINPFRGRYEHEYMYEEDLNLNVVVIRSHSFEKHLNILKFVASINSTAVAKNLNNKSLIFSGRDDALMPEEKGRELHNLLKRSKLIVKKRSHFNVFEEKDLKRLDEFLRA